MDERLEIECHISFTIERQLKTYMESKEHTERHEILWHEWNHNKRWLILVQQLILPSFPSYSMHDVTHSKAVLHNIEMLLGEDNIKLLSASDCFLILHTVYIHDIGMCITNEDKKNIIRDKKFHSLLEHLSHDNESGMNKYAEILLTQCIEIDKNPEKDEYRFLLNKKLDIYYAMTYLLAEYCRLEHGDISSKRLINWIDSPDKLGVGFSTIEIPDRLFYIIANCANTHTKWDFDEVLKLHQEDSGFAHDYVHPRFIAILLQLGDALDMDNDRFHPLFKEYLGDIPRISEIHYGKHKSIRRLRITNQKISISADCKDQDILRLVRKECDGIRAILKNATYFWSVIRPKEMNIGLPTFDKVTLLLDGNEIPEDLVETKFEIPQDKAFHLLEGNNIYMDNKFVFLREFLQNAIDATKIQYFRDCQKQKKRAHIEDISKPNEIKKVISPICYPVEIHFTIAKREKGKTEKVKKEDLEEINKEKTDIIYGVSVRIKDYGTGINREDIKQIAKVGTSYENRKEEIEIMPKWLQTTGIFGIGLQSAFLSSNTIVAETFTRKDESYEITFYPRRSNSDGYINVKPIKNDDYTNPYGTCFETFIPFEQKKLHKDSPETWDGNDPFEDGYDKMKVVRHSRELIKQMSLYLADMVGEPLFPITLYISDGFADSENELCRYYNNRFKKRFKNSEIMLYINDKSVQNSNLSANLQVSWVYNLNNDKYIIVNGDDIYFFNPANVKLYIWNHQYNAFACFGIKRILFMRDNFRQDNEDKPTSVKIFYKGIKISERNFKQDANLIEYIDLKDSLQESFLRLDRDGLSEKGYEYLENVYKVIVNTGHNALRLFAENYENTFNDYTKEIKDKIESLLSEKELKEETLEKTEELILSVAVLVYFAMINEQHELFKENNQTYKEQWNKFLKQIKKLVQPDDDNNNDNSKIPDSTLFKIPIFTYKENPADNKKPLNQLSVLDIIDIEKKFIIVSKRDDNNKSWIEYIIKIGDKEENIIIHDDIKAKIKVLHNEHDIEKRNDIIKELWNIAQKIINENYYYSDENVPNYTKNRRKHVPNYTKNRRKHVSIIKWFLNNVPTIAFFASHDGNIRLNVLDTETCNSVYFDENMKKHIIKKMLSEYKNHNISRFSTVVWSGYRYLALEQNRNSILSVNGGKMSNIGHTEMIFPLTGENLYELLDEDNILKKAEKIISLYNQFINTIINCINKIYHESQPEIVHICEEKPEIAHICTYKIYEYIDYIQENSYEIDDIQEKNVFNTDEIKRCLDNLTKGTVLEEFKIDIHKITCGALKDFLDLKISIDKSIDKLINHVTYWQKENIDEIPNANMINYVIKNTKLKIPEAQIETLYDYLIEEIFVTIKDLYFDILKKIFREKNQEHCLEIICFKTPIKI